MEQPPPLDEFAMAPAPVLAAPPPAQGPVLPAALRVFLYLAAAVVLQGVFAIPLMLGYIWYQVSLGRVEWASLADPTTARAILSDPWLLILSALPGFAATMVVTPVFTAFLDRRPFRSIGFQLVPGWWAHCLAGFCLDASHMTVLFGLGLLAGWYSVQGITPLPQSLLIFIVAAAIALPAAATEEIMMRGYVFQALEGRYGTATGIAVNSVLFALMHLGNPGTEHPVMVILGLIVAGLYFSVAYAATRQLWLPIVGHAMWNVFEGPVYGLPVSGLQIPGTVFHTSIRGPELWTGGKFGPEAGIPVIVTTLLWTGLVWYAGRALMRSGASRGPVPSGD